MEESGVFWRMFGANSMVRVNKNVMCLGFVDGGEATYITSIVIGGHQVEENLLTFDLDKSRLGFSSSLLLRQTTCENYRVDDRMVLRTTCRVGMKDLNFD
ncbi:hypothetical protein ACET3Z_002147 [Daucus carota]